MSDQTVFSNIMKSGGPAFPQSVGMPNGGTAVAYGMSLRDWFAGQALAGMCADPNLKHSWPEFAQRSYDAADAMLKARA